MGVREPREAVYVVKVRVKAKPPVTSMAWALYIDDELVPKYWEYNDGIYFTVFDPQFLTGHKGKQFRLSQNGIDFFDTGVKLTAPTPSVAKGKAAEDDAERAVRAALEIVASIQPDFDSARISLGKGEV
jgi:hypothetical protein